MWKRFLCWWLGHDMKWTKCEPFVRVRKETCTLANHTEECQRCGYYWGPNEEAERREEISDIEDYLDRQGL